ncbi:DUF6807 family protein [Pseudokineococcus sp. 5B2Z-1]|uniref:DUF6807 family protein n=1 Tax=Pseudokineococcus sp. 5B2Z-1 TaxID=3132744 RepID=UPI0030AE6CE7
MSPPITWEQTGSARGRLVGPEGQPLARWSWGPEANHPYVDELRPLAHRGVLTNHAPHDHRWHHGLWWSWKFVDDVLFWEDHLGYGGNRAGLGRSVVDQHEVVPAQDGVRVVEHLSWREDATGEVLLAEDRTLTATLDSGVEGGWALDWDQTWTALRGLTLSATPWPQTSWGGYAGLSYRAARAMAAGEEVAAAGGRAGTAAVHGQRAAWSIYGGCVDGAGTDEPERPARGAVALLDHPGNPGFPSPVYAASAVDAFGFLATAPLMHEERVLEDGELLRVRTRALVLDGPVPDDQLSLAHDHYAASTRSAR